MADNRGFFQPQGRIMQAQLYCTLNEEDHHSTTLNEATISSLSLCLVFFFLELTQGILGEIHSVSV